MSLSANPDTPEWNFITNNANDVEALRINSNAPAGCGANDSIRLNTLDGTYTGSGCYAAGAAYPAATILKGQ